VGRVRHTPERALDRLRDLASPKALVRSATGGKVRSNLAKRLRCRSVALEELNGALVALGGRAGPEGPEIPASAGSRVLLA
jgi:hypothetical protein